jgi:hypothetical protein
LDCDHERVASGEPRVGTVLAKTPLQVADFRFRELDRGIQVALLTRIFHLPVVPQVHLGQFQIAPRARSRELRAFLAEDSR